MRQRILAVARRETLHILRDPRSLAVALVLPVVMLLLYGYGINLDVRHLRAGFLDEDGTRESRELLDAFSHSGYFDAVARPGSYGGIDALLDHARVKVVVIVPRGYARDLRSGHAEVQVVSDGSDAAAASLAMAYAGQIAQAAAVREAAREAARRGATALAPTVDLRARYWYNPELKSNDFVVPGLAAVILMVLSALLTSLTIVRERERGSMEQVVVSPLRPAELMLGKLAPYVALAFVDLALVVGGGRLIFGVPFRGAPVVLLAGSLLFLISALALGLLVSTIANTQLVAMMIAVLATMLPAVLLSGFVFPTEMMPAPIRQVTYAVPARYYLDIVRGVMLKGAGPDVLWPQFAALTVAAAGLVALAARRFRKEL